jgi:hypothetical protein
MNMSAGPAFFLKHLQDELAGVFFFTPGRCQEFEGDYLFIAE